MISQSIETATIPYDHEAEQAILGTVILYNESTKFVISTIKSPTVFYTPAHQHIFRVFIELASKNDPIDVVTIGSELKSLCQLDDVGGYGYLSVLEECAIDPDHLKKWCEIVNEKAFLRQFLSITMDSSRKSRYPEAKAKDLIDETIEKLMNVRKSLAANAKAVSVFDCMPDIINNIELVSSGKMEIGLVSGYNDYDRHLGGGAQKGDLIFIGAEPSVGKTSLAVCLSYSMIFKSKKGLIASIESSKESIIRDRLLPAAIGVNSHKVRSGNLDQAQWDFLTELSQDKFLKNLKIYDNSTVTIHDLYSLVDLESKTNGIDFLMIDFFQLITPSPNTGNRNQDFGEIAKGLKRINKDFNIPIIALSQLTNGSKLRDSGELEQVADVIIFLERDEEQDNIINCIFKKNRNGIKGKVPLEFIPEQTKFLPVDQ